LTTDTEERAGIPELTGGAPLYRQPEPLNPIDHGKLGLVESPVPYSFAAGQHFVPALITEFITASSDYPVIFAGEEKAPIIVMGLRKGQNLFVPDAVNRGEAYIPAYIRRYPFIVANAADADNDAAVICIDRGSELVGENPTRPFYDGDIPSEYTNQCISFCQSYENDRIMTQRALNRLKELDLFELRTARFQPTEGMGLGTEPIEVAGYYAISSDKLNELPVETYIQLRDQGLLGPIFAHWHSQTQWDRLVARAIHYDRARGEATFVAKAAEAPAGNA
jgi:hypothetical protein